MAQVVLSEVGAAVGRWALPQGLQVLGQTVAGATLGRAIGSVAGRAIDAAFAGATEGPRVKGLHVMEAREGAGIPGVYGKMRVGGQVIWAARFREAKTTRSTGGKGGPKVSEFSYSVSFAVALGEGPILGVQRAWANGEAFDLSGVVHRIHTGTEDQAADPLIEMVEGHAPAYRGLAYIVFEDLPLDDFGNRLPQLSFEVARVPEGGSEAGLGEVVTGVNVIPASGEFVYATEIVRERLAPGRERALNANSGEARADFLVSLDQMERDLPRVARAALTVGWFGDSVAAGDCAIRPGVEVAERVTVPMAWSVDGVGREGAYLISRDEAGNANYGGTPADACVVQAIEDMKSRGIAVTLSPFLFMDSEGLPWRGRVTVSADGTAAAREEIEDFVEGPWGFRRFILHHADLALAAGGVEAFLIGSEMRGLTRVRDASGAFPFVEKLVSIAADVKAILPSVKVSYAADWTEYGAYVPGDGSGDVLFPLDALWTDENVDYVAVDWYPPMGDWRSGDAHLDAVAGYKAADDPDYLTMQLSGGEAFDWYYASEGDRDAQVRTPISDTAHGEHWVFRPKDLTGWAGAQHYERPGGVRAAAPTSWVPGAKPVRLSEIGFAAVDKGGNAPNLFFDPKSSESALPPYSTGARDDVFQKRALAVTLAHFEDDPLVKATFVWAWDGRPFPAWPVRDEVWGDGGNWARGHWLNGRAGLAPLADVVADICARGGVADVDVRELDGVVEGYSLDGVHSVRGALEPLKAAFGFECVERDGALVFRMQGEGGVLDVGTADLTEGGLQRMRKLVDKAPRRLRLTYVDLENDYQPGVAEARVVGGDPRLSVDVSLALAMGAGRAEAVARFLLDAAASAETAEAGLVLNGLALEPGDGLRVDGGAVWRVGDVTDAGIVRGLALVADVDGPGIVRGLAPGLVAPPAPDFGAVDLVVIDGPRLPGETDVTGPLVAAWADPWSGEVRVLAGLAADAMSERAVLSQPAVIGRLVEAVGAGPVGRWDRANVLRVYAPGGDFASLPEAQVLAGGNALLLETVVGWELVQFMSAELVGVDTWALSGLLRGQEGSESAAADEGARVVLVDGAQVRARVSPVEMGLVLDWRAAGDEAAQALVFEDTGGQPWRVAHLRRRGDALDWVRRGADVARSWAFPEAANAGRFVVEVDTGSGFGARFDVTVPLATLAPGVVAARVAETGADGRVGPWVSIGAGTS